MPPNCVYFPSLKSVSLPMHDAIMGNMLVYHGRRGDGLTGFGFAGRAGRKEEERKGDRGMLGALCWNFLVAATGFLLLGRFPSVLVLN